MRTARAETVSPLSRGVYLVRGEGGTWYGGVPGPGSAPGPGGSTGPKEVYLVPGGGVPDPGGVHLVPGGVPGQALPPCEQNHTHL